MNERYRNEAQQRLCKLILLMAGHEIDGVAPGALAKAIKTTPSNITRDLANLKEAGFAEEFKPGLWRLGPKVVQVAVSFFNQLDSAQARVDEVRQRYTRTN